MARASAGRRTVAGLLAAAAFGGLPACGGGEADRSTTEMPPAASVHAVERWSKRVQAAFAPLRSDAEGVPAAVTRVIGRPPDELDWRLGQRVVSVDGAEVWAVPGRTLLCLVRHAAGEGGASATCTTIARAIEHGVVLTSLAAPGAAAGAGRTIVGLVPDGTREVLVTTAGFPSVSSRVNGNTFTVRDAVTEPPESVSLLPERGGPPASAP